MTKIGSKLLEEKNYVIRLTSSSKNIIRAFATIVAFVFGWISLKGLPFLPIINQLTTELLLKVAISIYYFSWLYGTTLDASDQEVVFQKALDKGKVPTWGIVIAIFIFIFFLVLCASWKYKIFPTLLLCFWLSNYFIWVIFIKKVMKPYFDSNKKYYDYEGDYLTTKRFQIVEGFLYGKWQIRRFFIGSLILLPVLIFDYTNWFGNYLLKPDDKYFYIAFFTLIFVLVVELWIWYFRLKRKFSLITLTEIMDEYKT